MKGDSNDILLVDSSSDPGPIQERISPINHSRRLRSCHGHNHDEALNERSASENSLFNVDLDYATTSVFKFDIPDTSEMVPNKMSRANKTNQHEKTNQNVDSQDEKESEQDTTLPWQGSRRVAALKEREGQLLKKSPNVFHGWQSRFFVLHTDDLVYFKKGEARARGLIDLTKVSQIKITDEKLNRFSIQFGPKVFELEAPNKEEMLGWMTDIRLNCMHFPSSPFNKSIYTTSRKFWRVDAVSPTLSERLTISSEDIFLNARTGDILLFCTKGARGGLVRKATASNYDHVGLILKFRNGDVGLLEALGQSGVQISNFIGFVREKWNEQYSKIAIRHLESSLSKEKALALENFVKSALGKKYSWTPIKHWRRRASLNYADSARTFFCSELVAAAFKSINLLREDLPSSRYTPASFSQDYNLHLLQGASLSKEYIIQF